MFYSDELVEEVRLKNDIVDVVSGYVRLTKKGANHWGCCPFHNEKTPSFSVSGSKQMYYCFGCGAGGNVFSFIMNYENYSFPEAIKQLADRAGVNLPEQVYDAAAQEKADRRSKILECNKEAAKFFCYQLKTSKGEIGYEYLTKRRLSEETIKKFGLGYAGKNGAEVVSYLKSKGFADDIIIESGIANFSEKYGMSSPFWNRVMFPIMDIHSRVIGFGGRVMGDGEPKYLNSQETPVFDKRKNLYGLNFARTARSGNIIICEGYMDVIAMHQAGFTQAVASLGTAFTAEQANLLRRYTENVFLAYDSDGAGTKAAIRAIGILKEAGLSGKVINMKPYKDPDEFIKNEGREAFQERINNAENSFFFEIRILEGGYRLDDPEEKTKFHKEIAKKLCEFSVDVERENYLQAIAAKYYIGADNLRKLVSSYAASTGLVKPMERPKSGKQPGHDPKENEKKSQRLLLTWIADDVSVYRKVKKYVTAEDFTDELYHQVAERMFADLESESFAPAAIVNMFADPEMHRQVSEIFNTSLPELNTQAEKEKAFHDILYAVKKNSYEYFVSRMGGDMSALTKVIEGKKALEELAKTHISF